MRLRRSSLNSRRWILPPIQLAAECSRSNGRNIEDLQDSMIVTVSFFILDWIIEDQRELRAALHFMC